MWRLPAYNIVHNILTNPIYAGAYAFRRTTSRLPGDLPVIGPSAHAVNALHAFGFSTHGFQLGPIVGALIAELITTDATNLPITAFAVTRFASRERDDRG